MNVYTFTIIAIRLDLQIIIMSRPCPSQIKPVPEKTIVSIRFPDLTTPWAIHTQGNGMHQGKPAGTFFSGSGHHFESLTVIQILQNSMPSPVGRTCATVIGPYSSLSTQKSVDVYLKFLITLLTYPKFPAIVKKERLIDFIF